MDMIIQSVLVIIVGAVIFKAVSLIRKLVLDHYNINTKNNLSARKMYTQIKVIENILKFFVIFMTACFLIMVFPNARQIGISLLASAGVMGVVLGFAAQRLLGNLLAGIQIAFTQPIRIDDVVIVENEWGNIEEITLTYVVVRIWDLRRIVLPISYFIEKPFQNWTRVSADLMTTVMIYADYTVPIESVRQELTKILKESKFWDGKVNVLQVTNMTEKAVELRALMSAQDAAAAWDLKCEVREKLLVFLQEHHPQALPVTRVMVRQ